MPFFSQCSMKITPLSYFRNTRKWHILSATILFFGLWACTNDFLNPGVQIPSGQYTGTCTLTRNGAGDTLANGVRFQSSEVTLVINADQTTYRFVPMGDSSSILASNGVYTLAHLKLTLTDRTGRTFSDPALVMNGECSYTYDGANLVITQIDNQRKRERSLFLLRR